MLKHGAAISAIPGLNPVTASTAFRILHNGTFFAQKGGSISDAHSAIEINGEWGLVICWGGSCYRPVVPLLPRNLLTRQRRPSERQRPFPALRNAVALGFR